MPIRINDVRRSSLNDETGRSAAAPFADVGGEADVIRSAIAPVVDPDAPQRISLTSLGGTYTQNFNTLSNTAGTTTNSLPGPDWFINEEGMGARDNELYAVDTGGSNTGDIFSYGSAGSSDRALGSIQSGTLIPTYGATFTNNTGGTITSLVIAYTGEQWRISNTAAARDDRLDFQISFDATSLTNGTWMNVNELDFTNPIKTAAAAGALDGNAAANRVAISHTITGLSIASGAAFWIRWVDFNASGADDGLAIDDFSLTAQGAPALPTLSITDVTQDETSAGTTTFTFTVSLSAPAGPGGVTFDIATADGTGTAGEDYVANSLTGQTIPEGSTSYTFDVTVNGDTDVEPGETFFVNVTNITGATAGDGQGVGTITNDDSVTISIADVTQVEGEAGTTTFTFTVSLDRPAPAGGVTFDIATADGSGTAGEDYVGISLTGQTIPAGRTSYTFDVTVNSDEAIEGDETFFVNLTNVVGAVVGDGQATGTITTDDVLPVATIGDPTIAEGDDGVSYLVFTFTLDAPATGGETIDYATTSGTAFDGEDYLGVSGQITFAAGETSQTVRVPIIGDERGELGETLTVELSNATGLTVGDASGTGTIINDDGGAYHSLASGNFSQDWSNTGLITANDDWSNVPFIIGYLGDIDAGSPTGTDPRTLAGPALGAVDVIANLTAPNSSGGVAEFEIADPTIGLQGSGTADAPSIVLYMDASGRSDIRLQANLRDLDGNSDDAAQAINVQYRTSPGGAWTNVAGGYFADVTTAGSATQVTALDVTLPADANNAARLEIRIMTTNAGGSDEWVGIDDIFVSSQAGPASLSIDNAAIYEGDSGTSLISFIVTRSGDTSGASSATYTASFGGGIMDADERDFGIAETFTGTVAFAPGETTQTITFEVEGDVDPELDESFTVTLSDASGAIIGDGSATGTIVADDAEPPMVSVSDAFVAEGDAGTNVMTFTVTRTGGDGAFTVDYATVDGSATAGADYEATSGTLSFAAGETSKTVEVPVTGDTDPELSETLQLVLSAPTDFAVITDPVGVGTISGDDPIYIHEIQGSAYFSPVLTAEGITSLNVASVGYVTVQAIVTAVDDVGGRQGFYITEEIDDWDSSLSTSEGIFVMTLSDAGVGSAVSGVAVGDLVTVVAQVIEYRPFSGTMPITVLTNPSSIIVNGQGYTPPALLLDASVPIPNAILTGVTPDYFDSVDDPNDSFDAENYALSFFEGLEGMLVTIPDMVVADGFVSTSGGQPIFQAYSTVHANPDQINSRGGYTIAGDPPNSPPDTADTRDDTIHGGRHVHDGDVNPDIIEVDFSGFAIDAPAGLVTSASMGDQLGDVTGIIEFDFTDRKLYVTDIDPSSFVDNQPVQETTTLVANDRALTVATFNVENLDPGDGQARFDAIAQLIANNLNAPDIISIEEIQDNNGTGSGSADASLTWQTLVDALNAAVPGAAYQWVDQEPGGNEGGAGGGNIRVGFLYNTARVQLGDLAPDATIAERRQFTDRIGDGVRDAGDRILYSDDMVGGINPADWGGTRLSLLAQFTFNGNAVFVTANHLPAKIGSGQFYQYDQDLENGQPANSDWAQRNQIGEDLYSVLNLIQTSSPNAGVVAGGDFNEFYFNRPMEAATGYVYADGTVRGDGAKLDNLTISQLTEAERYTYTFDGRSQAIDHIIVNAVLSGIASYDVVHLNTGYNAANDPSLSDHDPAIASFDFSGLSETLTGTAGADTLDGMGGDDLFLLQQGGSDDVSGGEGSDGFYFGAALDAGDQVDGGTGTDDQVAIQGDYGTSGANFVLGGQSLVGIETLAILSGAETRFGLSGTDRFEYWIETVEANVAPGARLTVNANNLAADEFLFFDGSAETDGSFIIYGGLSSTDLRGGTNSDGFFFGEDRFNPLKDKVDGTSGADDQLGLRGDYSSELIFQSDTIRNIDTIALISSSSLRFGPVEATFSYWLTLHDNNVAEDATLTISAVGLEPDEHLTFDGSAELDGHFRILGGNCVDEITGGQQADIIWGGLQADALDGQGGDDVFLYRDILESSALTGGDLILAFDFGDVIDLTMIDADIFADGHQDFAYIGNAVFSGTAGELRIDASGGIAIIEADVDGDGLADFEIGLLGAAGTDFLVSGNLIELAPLPPI